MNKDFQELKFKAPAELHKILRDEKEKLRELKFNLAAGKVKNANDLKNIRKQIARILTILNSSDKTTTSKTTTA